MNKLLFFNSITIPLPKERIYKRLGYRSGTTRLSRITREQTEKYISEALLFIELKGVARVAAVKKNKDNITIGRKVFKSKLLSAVLKNSNSALLYAVTAGNKIMDEIKNCEQIDLTRAVIFDAVASEMTDSAFSWIADYINRDLLKKRECLTKKRISCGYHDFRIQYQKAIYDLLMLKKIEVEITKSCMLLPEKSATALSGVINL